MRDTPSPITGLSALTLAVRDMGRSVAFYEHLGFRRKSGGADAAFTSLYAGDGFLNLMYAPDHDGRWWGRAVVYVDDVDAQHQRVLAAGMTPDFEPRDAAWGERYFHLRDPDGHEISFARPL